ncbi:hypothetical protein, partial [Streptomyces sp. NRRL F-5123]|uniref:hypothetical protein n=1 Tax=Streptomyces sp. NRRL F-5123 TaxID=1463856 RepID=UPI0005B76E8E
MSDIEATSPVRRPASAKAACCRQHSSAANSGMPTSEAISAAMLRIPQVRATESWWSAPAGATAARVRWATRWSSGNAGRLGRRTSGMRRAIAGSIRGQLLRGQSTTRRLCAAPALVPRADLGGDVVGEFGASRAVADDADRAEPAVLVLAGGHGQVGEAVAVERGHGAPEEVRLEAGALARHPGQAARQDARQVQVQPFEGRALAEHHAGVDLGRRGVQDRTDRIAVDLLLAEGLQADIALSDHGHDGVDVVADALAQGDEAGHLAGDGPPH